YTVDDKEAWQTLEDNQQGWHAGDGSGSGNTESIGVEICENSDGDFQKAVSNAQGLIKDLMDKHNISIDNVVTHKNWSGKNCPHLLLNTWSSFKDGRTGSAPAPSKSSSSSSVIQWVGTNDKGKRIEAIVPSVNYYDTQRWTNPSGSFKKGEGWIV